MTDESTDAVGPVPTRRSTQAARPAPQTLPPTPLPPAPAPVPVSAPASSHVAAIDQPEPEVVAHATAGAPEPASDTDAELAWAPPTPRRPPALAGWALAVAIVGLIVSFVVGWGIPLGIIAIITAIAALRRPGARRQAAAWALALGILSVLYSSLWIVVALNSELLF